MKTVKVIDDTKIDIGGRTQKLFHHDPPFDGVEYAVEATTNASDNREQQFFLRELRGLTPRILPTTFDLSLSGLKSAFKYIDYLNYKKTAEGSFLTLFVCIDYKNWEYEQNLYQWSERYLKSLKESDRRIVEVERDKNEYGVSWSVKILVGNEEDIYDVYKDIEEKCESAYLNDIRFAGNASFVVEKLAPSKPKGELKWWIQHVIIPLLASGAFAAVIVWMLT